MMEFKFVRDILITSIKITIGLLFVAYVIVPIGLLYFPSIHTFFIFMTFLSPPWKDFSKPADHGVNFFASNFYLSTSNDVSVGVWHVLPRELSSDRIVRSTFRDFYASGRAKEETSDLPIDLISDPYPIMLYLHGNSFSRSERHRVDLYNKLADGNYHVFAIDYRGFGDSTGATNEAGCEHDGKFIFNWIKKQLKGTKKPIYIWGHSLGSAMGTIVTRQLCEEGSCPAALILEAAFNNFTEIVRYVPVTRLYQFLPQSIFDKLLVEPPIKHLGIDMNTDVHIRHVNCPILMIYAQDDLLVVPRLPHNLFESARVAKRNIYFVEFDSAHGFGHNHIHRYDKLLELIGSFINSRVHGLVEGASKHFI